MSMTTQTVDKPSGLCQQVANTEPAPIDMVPATCNAYGGENPKTSKRGGPRPGFGGPQPGSGRPRKIQPITILTYALDELRWYCVRTEYGAETSVDVTLRTAGFETFYPLLWVPPVAARRTELGRAFPATSERLVPLLPRYLLVRFDRSNPSWRYIPTMPGVERMFSTHPERPIPIPESDITALVDSLAPNGVKYPDAPQATVTRAKRRWVDMIEALKSMQEVA